MHVRRARGVPYSRCGAVSPESSRWAWMGALRVGQRVAALLFATLACPAIAQILAPSTAAPAPTESRREAESREIRQVRAQLTPRRYTTLAAEIGAKVNSLPVPEGGTFAAGRVLIVFDCSVQEAHLKRAESALSAAESTWRANIRLEELNSVGKLELDVSRAEVEKNNAEVAAMVATLSKCRVTAPFSGRIAEQKVREQQFVQPGQSLLDILDDSELEIEFIVPSRWLGWLKAGYAFRIRIDETGKSYPARVQRLGARVDPVSQSIKIVAAIDGRYPELLAGMSGQAAFGDGQDRTGRNGRQAKEPRT